MNVVYEFIKEFLFQANNSHTEQTNKKKTSTEDKVGIQLEYEYLESRMKLFMRNHMAYRICGQLDRCELCKMLSSMIVEMNVVMNQGTDSTLIRYLCGDPDLRRQSIGTSMSRIVFGQPEYDHSRIMAVELLPKHYKTIVPYNSNGDFFKNFSVTRCFQGIIMLVML